MPTQHEQMSALHRWPSSQALTTTTTLRGSNNTHIVGRCAHMRQWKRHSRASFIFTISLSTNKLDCQLMCQCVRVWFVCATVMSLCWCWCRCSQQHLTLSFSLRFAITCKLAMRRVRCYCCVNRCCSCCVEFSGVLERDFTFIWIRNLCKVLLCLVGDRPHFVVAVVCASLDCGIVMRVLIVCVAYFIK